MKPVVYISSDLNKCYEDGSFLGRIKDRVKITLEGESFIEDLNMNISRVKLPPNFNKRAYTKNMEIARKYMKGTEANLAPKTSRIFDYEYLNDFQRRLFAYSVVNSIKLLLRLKKKSIKNSCIVIYDAAENINSNIISELAKESRYCVLLSKNIKKASVLSDYIIANYGVSPIVTNDVKYALESADFIITSESIEVNSKKSIWYINNMFRPSFQDNAVNDVTYSVPWEMNGLEVPAELLGAILSQMDQKDIEASLKYNGVFMDKIKFNNMVKE